MIYIEKIRSFVGGLTKRQDTNLQAQQKEMLEGFLPNGCVDNNGRLTQKGFDLLQCADSPVPPNLITHQECNNLTDSNFVFIASQYTPPVSSNEAFWNTFGQARRRRHLR